MADIVRHLPVPLDSLKTGPTWRASHVPMDGPDGLQYAPEMESDQFTLEEANAFVPWLEEMFQRLSEIRQGLADSKGEADQPEEMSERLMQALEDGVQEIFDKGIIVRDVDRGLVDFPTQREGREVFLCWVGGEEKIDFWHETDRGFAHRQPL